MKIGVALPMTQDSKTGHMPGYREVRTFALQAETLGFDSIWLFDHLLFRFPDQPTGGIWEIWTLLSALAEATTRVELGALVMCVPFRNPALLAKMAATLDEVSAGRFILGLGAGWHQPEFDAFGVPFTQRVDRFEEALQIIVPLLRKGQVDFSGTHYRASNCVLHPRGPRPDGPPILIGAFGPRMLRLAARYADLWNTCWLGDAAYLAAPRQALEEACAAEDRDPATLAVTVGVTVVGPTPGRQAPPPEKALSGTVEEVAAALHAYAAAGVEHLICSISRDTPDGLTWFGEVLAAYRAGTR